MHPSAYTTQVLHHKQRGLICSDCVQVVEGGKLEEHAFAPQVDTETGLIQCSTMSFSAYVVAAVPIVVAVQTSPPPGTTLAVTAPIATPAPVKVGGLRQAS